MSSLSPNCSRLRSNHQKTSSTRLKSFRIVPKRHTTPQIASLRHAFHPNQSESSQNCSYSFPVFRISSKTSTNCFQSPQNFRIPFQNFDKLLSAFLLGHKIVTICPPNRRQTPQNVSRLHKLSRNQAKLMQIVTECPPPYRSITPNLNCDIKECLIFHFHVPTSTPIITNWSQIVKNAPSIQSLTPKTCRHSLTEISQRISSLIHHLSSLL